MIPMSSSTASEVLTRRVQALLIQAWIRVALYGMSLLLGVAVTSVTLMAFIDYSIRTEHFWLGGSFVWCSVALAGFWFVSHIQSWPTYFGVARQWEAEYPHLGESVSSAVGFLCEEKGPRSLPLASSRGVDDFSEPALVFRSEMKVLALEHAARASFGVPCMQSKWVFGALACFMGSCFVAFAVYFSGDGVWQQAVCRQVPPAVGGWSEPRPKLAVEQRTRQTALSAAEISVVTRVLLKRYEGILEHFDQDAGQAREEYQVVAAETLSLAEKVDADALLLQWFASQVAGSTGGTHLKDILSRVVLGGRAALSFSQATAMKIYLNKQLLQLFPQQAGLRPNELGSTRLLWLERLAESDANMSAVVKESCSVLCAEEIVGSSPSFLSGGMTSLLIQQNRLGRAIGIMDSFTFDCSKVVRELGLTVSNAPVTMKWDDSPRLAEAMVRITTVEAGIAETQNGSDGKDVGRIDGVQVASSPAGQGVSNQGSFDGVASGGAESESYGGTISLPTDVRTTASGLSDGRLWALWSPSEDTGRRDFVDQTVAGEPLEAFQRYVDRVTALPGIGNSSLLRQQK